MPFEELPEARYERLKKELQASILRDYPNPERKGCPGERIVRGLAEQPLSESIEGDPNWQHVTHCAECYREFLAFRESGRYRQRNQTRLGWGGVAAAILALGIYFGIRPSKTVSPDRPQLAELQYRKTTVDVESMARSGETPGEKKPILLEREPKELTIRLPVGSRIGTYEFQIRDAAGQAIIAKQTEAAIHDGVTELTVLLDLSQFASGNYSIRVRRIPFDWVYYPVVVQ